MSWLGKSAFAACGAVLVALAPFNGSAQPAGGCPPAQRPTFVLGFAALRNAIGNRMGEPTECEYRDAASGDTLQHTTTGLAYYRDETGTVAFTNGWERYALVGPQLLLWRNESLDPPRPSGAEARFVNDTLEIRARVDQLDSQLTAIQQQAQAGALDQVGFTSVGSILDELNALRAQFAAHPVPPDLMAYADLWLQAKDADVRAAEAILLAEAADDPAERTMHMQMAGVELTRRDQLRTAAQYAFTRELAIEVSPT